MRLVLRLIPTDSRDYPGFIQPTVAHHRGLAGESAASLPSNAAPRGQTREQRPRIGSRLLRLGSSRRIRPRRRRLPSKTQIVNLDLVTTLLRVSVSGCQECVQFCSTPEVLAALSFCEALEDNEALTVEGLQQVTRISRAICHPLPEAILVGTPKNVSVLSLEDLDLQCAFSSCL